MTTIQLKINGSDTRHEVDNRLLLVDLLRNQAHLTGTHVGCDTSQCGACTVLLDGQPVKACATLAVQADGSAVTTIEGLGTAQAPSVIQQAFMECHGLQCGFCTPGMVVSTAALLARCPQPTDAQIEHALEGNLCRCTGYVNIVESVRQAATALASSR
jgi:carbon-monoxide dehydrogenase small subunit